jgi:hypothetical protein
MFKATNHSKQKPEAVVNLGFQLLCCPCLGHHTSAGELSLFEGGFGVKFLFKVHLRPASWLGG